MAYLNLEKLKRIPEQEAYLNSTARFIAADCGRRSGKTVIAKRRMARAMVQMHPTLDNPLYLWGLPTYDQAKNTAWFDFVRIFQWYLDNGYASTRDMTLEVFTGVRPETGKKTYSKLLVRGMQNASRVEGVGYCGVVLDEMSDIPPEAYARSVYPAISDMSCNGWVMLIGVPKRRGVGAEFFREKCEEWGKDPSPDYTRFHWTSDIVLPPETILEARRNLDPKTFREQFMASWETAGGKVYYCFVEYANVVNETAVNPELPLIIGCDFNVNPMCWVICQAKTDWRGYSADRVIVLDELYLEDANTKEALNYLHDRYGNHKAGYRFIGDAAGNSRTTKGERPDISDVIIIEEDKRFWDTYEKITPADFPAANPSVLSRVASVNAMLRPDLGPPKLLIDKKCERLIKDFQSVTFANGREIDKKTNAELTHMSDALGYVIWQLSPIGFDL